MNKIEEMEKSKKENPDREIYCGVCHYLLLQIPTGGYIHSDKKSDEDTSLRVNNYLANRTLLE